MENLIEALTHEDIENLTTYITNYGTTHYQPLEADLSHILRFWGRNKMNLYKMFGERLTVSDFITFNMDESSLGDVLDTTLIYPARPTTASDFISQVKSLDWNAFETPKRVDEYGNNTGDGYWHIVGERALATNRVETDMVIHFPNGRTYKVGEGAKASKVLSKVAEGFGLTGYEEFRLAHSLCLNEKTLRGKLTLSIHPLDFLTMSDNDSGWSSCMRLRANCDVDEREHQGEYSQGPVEMMNSSCVVIAYLEAKVPMLITSRDGSKSFEWNNKKWRSLFIVNEDLICPIKGYPYNNDELDTYCVKTLKKMAEERLGYYYVQEDKPYYNDTSGTFYNGCRNITFKFHTEKMYCDISGLRYRNCYIGPKFYHPDTPSYIDFNYSGESECIICGRSYDTMWYSHEDDLVHYQPVCIGCGGKVYCCDCEQYVSVEDAVYEYDDWYCVNCIENNTMKCPICGDHRRDRDMIFIDLCHTFPNDKVPKDCIPSMCRDYTIVYYSCGDICRDCVEDDKHMIELFGTPVRDNRIDAKELMKHYYAGNTEWMDILDITKSTMERLTRDFPKEIIEAEDS
jgi:hypothetical protein